MISELIYFKSAPIIHLINIAREWVRGEGIAQRGLMCN